MNLPRSRCGENCVRYCSAKDNRYDLFRIASEVEGADIIALREVKRHRQRSGWRGADTRYRATQ